MPTGKYFYIIVVVNIKSLNHLAYNIIFAICRSYGYKAPLMLPFLRQYTLVYFCLHIYIDAEE